jgi:hypothetical protein
MIDDPQEMVVRLTRPTEVLLYQFKPPGDVVEISGARIRSAVVNNLPSTLDYLYDSPSHEFLGVVVSFRSRAYPRLKRSSASFDDRVAKYYENEGGPRFLGAAEPDETQFLVAWAEMDADSCRQEIVQDVAEWCFAGTAGSQEACVGLRIRLLDRLLGNYGWRLPKSWSVDVSVRRCQ